MKYDKFNNDEGRIITDEDYKNDLRHKHVLIGFITTTKGVGGIQQNVQAIECYNNHGIKILNREPVVLNREIIAIVAQIVQLIFNCF